MNFFGLSKIFFVLTLIIFTLGIGNSDLHKTRVPNKNLTFSYFEDNTSTQVFEEKTFDSEEDDLDLLNVNFFLKNFLASFCLTWIIVIYHYIVPRSLALQFTDIPPPSFYSNL